MALHEQLTNDLKDSMRSRDTTRTSVIRLLKSAITYEEKNKGATLDDEGIVEVVVRQAKQRRESIEQFQKGQRQDLVDKELAELKELQRYLPEQMSLDDIRSIALAVISELNATGIEMIIPRTPKSCAPKIITTITVTGWRSTIFATTTGIITTASKM